MDKTQAEFYATLTPEQQEQYLALLEQNKTEAKWGIVEAQNHLISHIDAKHELLFLAVLEYKLAGHTGDLTEVLTSSYKVIEENWDNLPHSNKGFLRSVRSNLGNAAKARNAIKKNKEVKEGNNEEVTPLFV